MIRKRPCFSAKINRDCLKRRNEHGGANGENGTSIRLD